MNNGKIILILIKSNDWFNQIFILCKEKFDEFYTCEPIPSLDVNTYCKNTIEPIMQKTSIATCKDNVNIFLKLSFLNSLTLERLIIAIFKFVYFDYLVYLLMLIRLL